MGIMDLLWIFLMFSALQPAIRQRMLEASRTRVLFKLERKRKSRVIALVHRQETMAFLGFPIARFIRELGLPVSVDIPEEIYRFMTLFPQPQAQRPSVQYVPVPYAPRQPAAQPAGAKS